MKKLLILGQLPKEIGGNYTTGVANVVVELSKLIKDDFDTHVYATNFNGKTLKKINGVKIFGYSKLRLLFLLFNLLIFSPVSTFKIYTDFKKNFGVPALKFIMHLVMLKYYIKKIKPNIINAHGIMFAPIIKHSGYNYKKIFYTFHGLMYDDNNSIKANKKRLIDVKKLYNNSAELIKRAIYLTDEMRIKAENKLKINAFSSSVISNGVNVEKFKFCISSRHEIRSRYNIKTNDKIILTVGALTNRKNHLGFIKYLKKNNFKGHYWIVGKFEAQETKQKILALMETIKNFEIRIFNYIDHNYLYKYYSAADTYGHPSTSEGQALVVFEALCCGLPIIVNEKIKKTLSLEEYYLKYISVVNLETDKLIEIKCNDREGLSISCKKDFNWKNIAKKYKKTFEDGIN